MRCVKLWIACCSLWMFWIGVPPPPAAAETLIVPDQFPFIQAAIDYASDGDLIEVHAGTYRENLVIEGKALALVATDGSQATVIDGSAPTDPDRLGVVFVLASTAFTIEGFTITHGDGGANALGSPGAGGGLYLGVMAGAVRDCVIEANRSTVGGGVYLYNSSPAIEDCWIRNNNATNGAGLAADGTSAPEVRRTLVTDNFNDTGLTGFGGGLYCRGPVVIENCTVVRNGNDVGSGLFVSTALGVARVARSIIAFNNGPGGAMSCSDLMPDVECCDFFGNAGGDAWCGNDLGENFSLDPLFCDGEELRADSPCAAANAPAGCGLIGALEVACDPHAVEPSTWGRVKESLLRDRSR